MKKVLICGVIAAAFGATSAFADTSATAPFNVTATVNAKCLADNATTPVAALGTIDAFAASTSATADVKFKCTRGLTVVGSSVSKPSSSVAGFTYSATIVSTSKTTAGALGGTNGGADGWTVQVKATTAGNEAGDAGAAVNTSDAQVLTVTF